MSENERLKQIIYYKTVDGHCPYLEWLNTLDNKTQSIIVASRKIFQRLY